MLFLNLFLACGEKTSDTSEASFDVLSEFEAQLSGRFTSEAQSREDPSYFAVQLQACTVDAPELGEHVLYVEQALVDDVQSPYRQRLYVLEEIEEGTKVRSNIYTLTNEDSVIGLCNQTEMATFSASEATLKEGCHVELTWNGTGFNGQTEEGTCPSDMNGASYATSVVTTTPNTIESWDQGWNDQGEQMWGAVSGAYIFDRIVED